MTPPPGNRPRATVVVRLAALHIGIIALANYTVQFTATVFGQPFTWAMFIFPLAILATDLTVRLSGQHTARTIIGLAYLPAIAISAWLADWRIGLASGTAYLLGQLLDISVFQALRERSRRWWVAPGVSTFCSNITDTGIFYTAAFYRSGDPYMAANWPAIAGFDMLFKIIISTAFFLPAYGLLLGYLQQRLHSSSATA